MKDVTGIWVEESDAMVLGQKVRVKMDDKEYETSLMCDLIHPNKAKFWQATLMSFTLSLLQLLKMIMVKAGLVRWNQVRSPRFDTIIQPHCA